MRVKLIVIKRNTVDDQDTTLDVLQNNVIKLG